MQWQIHCHLVCEPLPWLWIQTLNNALGKVWITSKWLILAGDYKFQLPATSGSGFSSFFYKEILVLVLKIRPNFGLVLTNSDLKPVVNWWLTSFLVKFFSQRHVFWFWFQFRLHNRNESKNLVKDKIQFWFRFQKSDPVAVWSY